MKLNRVLYEKLHLSVRNTAVSIWDSFMYRGPVWRFAYSRMPEPKEVIGRNPLNNERAARIIPLLYSKVETYQVDVQDFFDYVERTIQDYEGVYRNFTEKSLEHYVSFKLLELEKGDTYIDIASSASPVPKIVSRLFGVNAYSQDLSYEKGVHGNTIGGDAGDLPVGSGFTNKMALHCSFEHFEGDSDVRFMKECNRILPEGGKVCILPLYLSEVFRNVTDPTVCLRRMPEFDKGALISCRKRFHSAFGRNYDPLSFEERIVKNLDGLSMTIYHIENSNHIDDSVYLTFAAVISK